MKKWIAILLTVCMLLSLAVSVSAAETTLTVTVPFQDENEDGINDYVTEVGTLSKSYVYSYSEPSEALQENETEILSYTAEIGKNYFYRVSNPLNEESITYANFVTAEENTAVEVTGESMLENDESISKKTALDVPLNGYDVPDIYLNVNEAGYLSMSEGETFTLYPQRNWQIIEGITNSKIIQPDFHVELIEIEGENVVTAEENKENSSEKHSFLFSAQNQGTVIVKVTYDAIVCDYAMGTEKLFSAVNPENAAFFVITVGKENGVETGAYLNKGRNATDKKLSGDYIDSELDVIYYTNDEGAEYTVYPEEGVTVSVLNGTEFSTENVAEENDATIVSGLTSGSHILKFEKENAEVSYQVIRTKKVNLNTTFYREEESVGTAKPGDRVEIAFDRLYHPVNKLAGVYNSSAKISYIGQDETEIKGAQNQYQFAYTEDAQRISFVIPDDFTGDSYTLTSGAILTSGYSSAFGAHRSITYTDGKSPDFGAVSNVSYMGSLPDIVIPVEQPEIPEETITVKVGAYDYTAVKAKAKGASETGVILDAEITVPVGTSAEDAVKLAFEQNNISYKSEYGYISEINGLGAGDGYSGWCFNYNNDDYANMGLSSVVLSDGDVLRFDYSCNYDTVTDDIGNGWYGLPIITELKIAGKTLTMRKTVEFTQDDSDIKYYVKNGTEAVVEGNGTEQNPFLLSIEADYGTKLSELKAEITTSLNENYCIINGLSDDVNFENAVEFSVSSLSGKNKAYFKIKVTVAEDDEDDGGTVVVPKTINVKFRVIGATKASADVDLAKGKSGYNGSEYKTFRKTTSYTVNKGTTAYELMKKAMDDAGLSYKDENGYVSEVKAPSALGGYSLKELDNGPYSGWMYTVNGKHTEYAMKEQILKDNDVVILHYVNDYRYEVSDWSGGVMMGDGNFAEKWLEASDTNPKKVYSGGSSVSTNNKKEEVKEEPKEELKEELKEEAKPEITVNFTDVNDDAWYKEGVCFVTEKGFMKGMSDTEFEPYTEMTRAMLVTVLYRIAGSPEVVSMKSFDDVEADSWYAESVLWANENGIVLGYNENTFGSNDKITREQLAVILYRYAEKTGKLTSEKGDVEKYSDKNEISEYAVNAFEWAVKEGIISGVGENRLMPKGDATRAQIAVILMRFLSEAEAK